MSFDNKFDQFLKEDVPPHFPSPGNPEIGLTSKEQQDILDKLNDGLAPLNNISAVNPYYMIQRIKDRLKLLAGLTFDDTYLIGNAGTKESYLVPVDHVNVRTFNNRHYQDNAFLKLFPNGLVVKFQFLKVGNIYHIDARITPGNMVAIPVSEN